MVNTVTISVAGVLKSSTSPALDAVLRTADLLCSHNCSFAPFDQLLPTPPVLVWPLVAAWCWGGLAPESLWGWGPWGGHGLASAGPVSAEGTWRQEVQGPAQQQSSWGWPGPGGRFTLLPTGRHHPPVGPPRDAADTSDGPAFLSSSGTCSHVCAPQGLWSFTWMDP